eukprot:5509011-Heterocapsa_arctica.AAC.1
MMLAEELASRLKYSSGRAPRGTPGDMTPPPPAGTTTAAAGAGNGTGDAEVRPKGEKFPKVAPPPVPAAKPKQAPPPA